MGLSRPCLRLLLTSGVLMLLCQVITNSAYAQLLPKDSLLRKQYTTLKESAPTAAIRKLEYSHLASTKDSLLHFFKKPAFAIHGGYISYNFNYRSVIDTPYAEKDIMQHNVSGRFDLSLGSAVPLQVNYWLRQSNSNFFKNIVDVQLSFNGAEFRNRLRGDLRSRLLALAPSLQDSMLEKLHELKLIEQLNLGAELKSQFSQQKVVQANEVLRVPEITWQKSLPDSVNRRVEDSLKKMAGVFLDLYAKKKEKYEWVSRQVDSLKILYDSNRRKIERYKQLLSGEWSQLQTNRQLKDSLEAYGLSQARIPPAFRWLMGIRNFSLGRSPVNYSELTTKNISVNGINFEYNTWYYFAVTAGKVNYRFRDFVVNGAAKQPQYVYMLRAGIGKLEKSYFILSAFKGQKQLFRTGGQGNATVSISGLSAETRWAINRYTSITAEVAKSIAPDYRNNPAEYKTKLVLSDNSNQAFAVKLQSYWPKTGSRIEGFFKKAGANFQSFSSFQTSSAIESWGIKAEQNFFGRKFRLAGSLRKNEFTNPFIVQEYNSNAMFKSVTASLRLRKWPVITAGYQPLSQLTKIDNQVMENRFQTFNATGYHQYTVKQLRMATTVMWNKFYNNATDTGFVYYNAVNSYLMQSFFFSGFTANVGASLTRNTSYQLQVMDGYVQPHVGKFGTIGVGIKINNMNNTEIKTGAYMNASIHILKHDVLLLSFEQGYLPGISGKLVRNAIGSVQFIKTFNFR